MSHADVVRLHPRQPRDFPVAVVVVYNSKRVVNSQVFSEKKDALAYAEHMRQVGYRTKTLRRRVYA